LDFELGKDWIMNGTHVPERRAFLMRLLNVAEFASDMCQKNCNEDDWDLMEDLVDRIGLPNGRVENVTKD